MNKSLDERYENISARIAEKIDKNWLLAKCSSEEDILEECAALCEKIYESLPDGIHRHADGKLYFHQTYTDPRNPKSKGLKTIGKL